MSFGDGTDPRGDLTKLQTMCERARMHLFNQSLIIAGGAPRDLLSGVPVKDIDLFVYVDEPDEGKETPFIYGCNRLAADLGGTAKPRPGDPSYENFLDLVDIECEGRQTVQVVMLHSRQPVDDIPFYDFGLSQIFVTPTGVFMTEAATLDRAARTITYMKPADRDKGSKARSKARLGRLRAKYEGWAFVNCETLDDYNPPPKTEEQYTRR